MTTTSNSLVLPAVLGAQLVVTTPQEHGITNAFGKVNWRDIEGLAEFGPYTYLTKEQAHELMDMLGRGEVPGFKDGDELYLVVEPFIDSEGDLVIYSVFGGKVEGHDLLWITECESEASPWSTRNDTDKFVFAVLK